MEITSMLATIEERLRTVMPAVDFCSLRLVHERGESLSVVRGQSRTSR